MIAAAASVEHCHTLNFAPRDQDLESAFAAKALAASSGYETGDTTL
jgi:hypothetical protein